MNDTPRGYVNPLHCQSCREHAEEVHFARGIAAPTPPSSVVRDGAPNENKYFGKDCPAGMVQVEFVGAHAERYSDYGWKPGPSAFLEIYVDGQRFRVDVGTFHDGRAERRGLHINGPLDIQAEKTAMNAVSVFVGAPATPASTERTGETADGEMPCPECNRGPDDFHKSTCSLRTSPLLGVRETRERLAATTPVLTDGAGDAAFEAAYTRMDSFATGGPDPDIETLREDTFGLLNRFDALGIRIGAANAIIHEMIHPDNGYCNQCRGHWLYRPDTTWVYEDGTHLPTCIGRKLVAGAESRAALDTMRADSEISDTLREYMAARHESEERARQAGGLAPRTERWERSHAAWGSVWQRFEREAIDAARTTSSGETADGR